MKSTPFDLTFKSEEKKIGFLAVFSDIKREASPLKNSTYTAEIAVIKKTSNWDVKQWIINTDF